VSALIVDDNATNQAILDRQLKTAGIVATLAADAPSAIEFLRQAAQASTGARVRN